MNSLAPACTPLKHRYDACFNSWFEGYLQPALDQAGPSRATEVETRPTDTTPEPVQEEIPQQAIKKHWLLPNFGISTRPRTLPTVDSQMPEEVTVEVDEVEQVQRTPSPVYTKPINTSGKTRAQIKAEEYDRNCGAIWKDYKECLHNAISENAPLAALLEQARLDNPLESQQGLEGSPWDPDTPMSEGKKK